MNLLALLEFELAYYDIVVQHISHYATGIIPKKVLIKYYFHFHRQYSLYLKYFNNFYLNFRG